MESSGISRLKTVHDGQICGRSSIFATIVLLVISFTGVRVQYVQLLPEMKNYVTRCSAVWDTSVFVAAGWSPELIFSNDRMKTITYKPFNLPPPGEWQDVFGLYMTSPSTIFLSAVQKHYVSRDTGNTWTAITPEYPTSLIFSSMSDGIFCSLGKVHFTRDGGNTWTVADFVAPNYRGEARGIFANGTMFVEQSMKLYQSTNCGTSWTQAAFPQDYFANNMHIWGGTNAFFLTGGKVYLTTNSGVNWSVTFTPPASLNILKVFSHDSVYAFNKSTAELLLYRNYFTSYEVLHQFTPGSNIRDLDFTGGPGIIVTLDKDSLGIFAVSNDGGHNFQSIRKRQVVDPQMMKFFNDREGCLVYAGTAGTYFIYTTDGGTTWSEESRVPVLPQYAYNRYPESLTSFIELDDYRVVRYTYGTGYSEIFNGMASSDYPHRPYLYNDSVYYLIASNPALQSTLWKSSNRGKSWLQVTSYGPDYWMHDIYLHDDSTGFAILNSNVVKIKQGGKLWEPIPMFPAGGMEDIPGEYRIIKSFNDSTVYVRINNLFYRTTNSGELWDSYFFNGTSHITDAIFLSADTGFVTTDGTYPVRMTTNGGKNWMNATPLPGDLSAPLFLGTTGPNSIFMGTYHQLLFTSNMGGQPLGIEDEEVGGINPDEFNLTQNWPNPFNPSTMVIYNLPSPAEVQISVHNIMGETVRYWPKEFREKGSHSFNFDGAGLPSGVYILSVTAGNSRRAVKMVLLK